MKSQNRVLACSALKQSYRDRLASGLDLRVCYLEGTYREVASRLQCRTCHFAGETIVPGQVSNPEETRDAFVLPVSNTSEGIVEDVLQKLQRN